MTRYDIYRRDHKIKSLYDYHAKYIRNIPNPKHIGGSQFIIAVKNKHANSINYIATMLENEFSEKLSDFDVICVMPSSNALDSVNGIRMVAQSLAKRINKFDGTHCVKRSSSKPRSCAGARSYDLQWKTLDIQNKRDIQNKKILLLDDVSTSGITLVAGAEKLLQAGATKVIKFAIGETVYGG